MALQQIGLGAILSVNANQAVQGFNRARNAMGQFVAGAQKVPPAMRGVGDSVRQATQSIQNMASGVLAGTSKIASGLGALGLAMAPFTLGIGLGMKQAVAFEKAMSRVDAVTLGSVDEMRQLTNEAKKLGINTVFSASQAAEGMEIMARAGADTKQIIGGIGGVLNAASAEGISMEKSADIIGIANATMGLSWDKASHTANVLAGASAATQSSIESLGESFSYGGLQASVAGMSLERTAAIMGLLHNAGLKGSTAGTALQNALISLAKPSEKGAALLKKWKIQMTQGADGALDLANIVTQVQKKVDGLGSNLQKTAAVNELFGIRGGRAYFAMTKAIYDGNKAGEESINALTKYLEKSSEAFEGQGVAAEMSRRQLDNLAGAWTMVTSSMEGAAIEVFGPMLKPLATMVRHATDFLNVIILGVGRIRDSVGDNKSAFEAMSEVFKSGGSVALNIVAGVVDAIGDMQRGFEYVESKIKSFTNSISKTFGGNTIRKITRFTMLFSVMAGVVSPILLGLTGIAMIIRTGIMPVVSGLLTIVSSIAGAITLPVVALVGAVALGFAMVRRSGESMGETLTRVFFAVAAAGMEIWESALKPLIGGILDVLVPGFEQISAKFNLVVSYIKAGCSRILSAVVGSNSGIVQDWTTTGRQIGTIVLGITNAVIGAAAIMAEAFELVTWAFSDIIPLFQAALPAISSFYYSIMDTYSQLGNLIKGFKSFADGGIIEGFKKIGLAIVNFITTPMKMALRQFITLADAIGAGNLVPDFARESLKNDSIEQLFGIGTKEPDEKPEPLAPKPKTEKPVGGWFPATPNSSVSTNQTINNINQAKEPVMSKLPPSRTIIKDGRRISLPLKSDKLFDMDAVEKHSTIPIPPKVSEEKPAQSTATVDNKNLSFMDKAKKRYTDMRASISDVAGDSNALSDAEKAMNNLGMKVAEEHARNKREEKDKPPSDVKIDLTDKREIKIHNKVCMDGAEVARATERHREEINERAGFRATPWERRIRVEHGASRLGG